MRPSGWWGRRHSTRYISLTQLKSNFKNTVRAPMRLLGL
jgi:hypothetical protein